MPGVWRRSRRACRSALLPVPWERLNARASSRAPRRVAAARRSRNGGTTWWREKALLAARATVASCSPHSQPARHWLSCNVRCLGPERWGEPEVRHPDQRMPRAKGRAGRCQREAAADTAGMKHHSAHSRCSRCSVLQTRPTRMTMSRGGIATSSAKSHFVKQAFFYLCPREAWSSRSRVHGTQSRHRKSPMAAMAAV